MYSQICVWGSWVFLFRGSQWVSLCPFIEEFLEYLHFGVYILIVPYQYYYAHSIACTDTCTTIPIPLPVLIPILSTKSLYPFHHLSSCQYSYSHSTTCSITYTPILIPTFCPHICTPIPIPLYPHTYTPISLCLLPVLIPILPSLT